MASLDKWDEYTAAKESMFFFTDLADAPWTVVKSNDKRRARLEAMRHVLSVLAYEDKDAGLVGRPDPLIVGPAPMATDRPIPLLQQIPIAPLAEQPLALLQ